MNKFGITRHTLILICLLFITSCQSKEEPNETTYKSRPFQTNPSMTKYHGSYMVDVKGAPSNYETEGYALKEDGTAVWFWIINNGQDGAEVKEKKYGSWTAEKNKIMISINGNAGSIVETYIDKDGKLINADNPDRLLKSGPY